MLEVNVTITAEALSTALNNLADSINGTHSKGATAVENPTTPVQSAPTIGTAAPTHAPAPVQANAPTPAAPTAPAAPAESYTLEALSRAGAALIDAGKMPQLLALLDKFGVKAVTQLSKDAYNDFAAELKSLGAQL